MSQNNLLDIASFSPDLLQAPSAWLGHLPFAAWVIREVSPKIFVELGTHSGNSYFAFCQSVSETGLSTKCYAVDTWQGDEHAGRYGDEIFAKVNAHHQENYAGFSRLLRMTFDDAVTYFADESIDLLHIDGLHTYEAVRHDFETWLPKLAPGAVVMFHDTNVRERNFGVWKLWAELQAIYPNNLEFVHSHGLGVLQLNNAPPDKRLEWLQPDSPEKEVLKNYFAALGSRQLERFELNELKQHAASLNQAVTERDGQIATLNQAVTERDGQIANLTGETVRRGVWAQGLGAELKEERAKVLALTTSHSWRITRPLREAKRCISSPKAQAKRYAKVALRIAKRMYQSLPLSLQTKARHRQWIAKIAPRVEQDIEILPNCQKIDWDQYKQQYCPWTDEHPSIHYLRNWRETRPTFPGFFCTSLYLDIYPDIAEAGLDPLLHFLRHGIKEGRVAWLNMDEFLEAGGQAYRPELKTVMIVSHESSATGAPIVALEVAKRLNERYNVMTVALRKDKLHDAFVQASCLHVNAPNKLGLVSVKFVLQNVLKDYGIHALIINSVESSELLYGAACFGLPTVSLLHEYADYTRPVGKTSRALFTTDIAIYPAASIKESGLRELRETYLIKTPLNHIWTRPQGSMRFNAALQAAGEQEWSLRNQLNIPDSAIVLAGAGHVQPRTGVDWFLETAYHLLKRMRAQNDKRVDDIHFVWLGDGFTESDINVSVWLETFMQRTGMRARCHFPGHVDSVIAALRQVDVYLLTSRLDPFPNVAVDALESDCGIACFEGASGVADFVRDHAARAVVAPYGDCPRLAELILDKLTWLASREGNNTRLCREHLDFERYVNVIEQALEEARRRQDGIREVIERCPEFTSRFDADFYGKRTLDMGPFTGDSRRDFLALLQKGIILAKPYPGSDIQRLVNKRNYDGSQPFIEYVTELMANDKTDCVMVDGGPAQLYTGRIALQFHVYYNDLIPEYAAWFRELKEHAVDLYVSHVHALSEADAALLRDAVSGSVHFERTPNLGRDAYPFHLAYAESIQGHYEVVGHFHTKKSKDCGGDTGVRWRKYLLQNLIGSVPAARQILGLFNDPRVGLVYAEDRHCVDEGENRPYIEQLLGKMDIEPQGDYFNFPLGTMFWARADALAPLARLDKAVFRIPEPIPYDGSVLHAFERIIPHLVRHEGYESVPVYTNGTEW